MSDAQHEFADFLISSDVVEFGDFTLKSGRNSPYFFNFGKLSSARLLNKAAWFYARFISENNLSPEVIFGPAYKGIPLGVAIALSLQRDFHTEVNYAFNRKEIKSYGDGGLMVGAALQHKRIVTVDDVITSGMTIDDSIKLIRAEGGLPAAYLVALDRQERGAEGPGSALQRAAARLNIDIYSITTIGHILSCLRGAPDAQSKVRKIEVYLKEFGAE
ncbi:orotate phosphoribosyltransferase (plasmid) [Chimaeribacter arupi]|uniref:orotate phosphoribosyltransferase n=1 Tax=Chimaeribacter arupi TaxID=2060066 RepID=UPI0027120A72|nr:orotate phosphoribosyltransferase [Chimaeribacter arupi]WKZ94918.1 orotate phosphoribosyltransferase [Chimaeribacter arupi]